MQKLLKKKIATKIEALCCRIHSCLLAKERIVIEPNIFFLLADASRVGKDKNVGVLYCTSFARRRLGFFLSINCVLNLKFCSTKRGIPASRRTNLGSDGGTSERNNWLFATRKKQCYPQRLVKASTPEEADTLEMQFWHCTENDLLTFEEHPRCTT